MCTVISEILGNNIIILGQIQLITLYGTKVSNLSINFKIKHSTTINPNVHAEE